MRVQMLVLTAALGLTAACGGKSKGDATTSKTAETSLYDRLGRKDAITTLVDDFISNVAADARISSFFANADIPGLKAKIVDQICEVSGGPCKYTGRNMLEAHTGMSVKDEHFTAIVEDLQKSFDKLAVDKKAQAELLTLIGGMKTDIVGH